SKSDIEDMDDFKAAVKETDKFSVGGYGSKSGDHIFETRLAKELGIDPQYVPFDSGGEVMTAVVGGNVDAAVTTVNNALKFIESDKMRGLGIASQEPLKQEPEIPTLESLGFSSDVNE